MSTPTPVTSDVSVTVPALVRIGLDFLVRSLVRKASPTAQAAAAQTVIDVCGDILGAWDDADPTTSLTDLATVIFGISSTTDPATADAIKTIALTAAQKILGAHDALAGTALDTLIGNILNEVLGQVIMIAQDYVPATPTPAPVPAPAPAAAKSSVTVGPLHRRAL